MNIASAWACTPSSFASTGLLMEYFPVNAFSVERAHGDMPSVIHSGSSGKVAFSKPSNETGT